MFFLLQKFPIFKYARYQLYMINTINWHDENKWITNMGFVEVEAAAAKDILQSLQAHYFQPQLFSTFKSLKYCFSLVIFITVF